MKHPFWLVLFVAVAAVPVLAADAADDLDRLQGTWTLVSMEHDGKAVPAEALEGRVVRIEGKKFTDRKGKRVYGEGTIALVGTDRPLAIDATFTAGPPKGKTSKGIYELDGDTLKACAAEPGDERPKAFESERGSRRMLVVYRKAKP